MAPIRRRCASAVAGLGNLSLMERPVRTLTLITALHSTLRARNKQYQVREAARRKDEFLASLGTSCAIRWRRSAPRSRC
jgi:hypothetical protein